VFSVERATAAIVTEKWLEHSGDAVDQFYGSLPPGSEVGVGGQRQHAAVRAQAGRAWASAAAGRSDKDSGERDAQAEVRSARCRAHRSSDDDKGDFPELSWVPTLGTRDQRQLLLHRRASGILHKTSQSEGRKTKV